MARLVELQVAYRERGWECDRGAPLKCPQSREQFPQVERLHQVVVGARVQAGDPVLWLGFAAQHKDGKPVATAPQLPHDVNAGHKRDLPVDYSD